MSSEIDDKIVSITFDNGEFEKKLGQTIAGLDALNQTIQLVGAKEGFTDLSNAAGSFDISNMSEGIDNISSKFSALGAIGFTVIQDLTRAATGFVQDLASKVSAPILIGGKNRAENIEQAKFLFRGLGMDIEATMASAKEAVLGTAYGLDAAAKTAAQLGGSGMRAGAEMTGALRGIAGAAAMTNTSFEEMSDIFTSAAGKGTVSGYELQRIGQRGLNAAAALGKQWGMTEQQVREAASNGEISFKKFAEGMNAAFGEHATKANETYTGSLSNLKAAFARLGAVYFGPNLEQQRDLFNAITPKVDQLKDAITPLINVFVYLKRLTTDNLIAFFNGLDFTKWKQIFDLIGGSLATAFVALDTIVRAVKDAFKDVFPGSMVDIVLKIAEGLRNFTEHLKMGGKTAALVTSIFHGVFSVWAILVEIGKGVINTFKAIFDSLSQGAGGSGHEVLLFFARMGEALFELKKALVDDGGIAAFFEKLTWAIANPRAALELLKNTLGDVKGSIQNFADGIKDSLNSLFGDAKEGLPGASSTDASLGRVGQRFDQLHSIIKSVSDALQPLVEVIGWVWERLSTWFAELGSKLAAVMDKGDFNNAVDMVNAGLIGGILFYLKRFVDGGLKLNLGGITDRINDLLDSVTERFKAMQVDLKANALLKIAGAMAIMTISLVALSMIDSAALTKALIAIVASFKMLQGVMEDLGEIGGATSTVKIAILASSMILLAGAMTVLAVAIKILGNLSITELAKGLIGVGVSLKLMVAAINGMTSDTGGLIRAGLSMMAIAVAMRILANAMQAFGTMSWVEIAKGLVAVAGGLYIMVKTLNAIDAKDMISAGIGIVAIAVGMRILANAMQAFATMSWTEMAKGLIAVGAALGIIVLLTNTMPAGGMIGIGVGLVAVGLALNLVAHAVESMGEMKLSDLAKGLGALVVVMAALALGTNAMNAALPGAAAMVIVAGALLVLSNVVQTLGGMKIGDLVKGIVAMVAVILTLAVVSAVIQPFIGAMLAMGIAMGILGAAFALFGAGAYLVIKALELLSTVGKDAMNTIFVMIGMFIARVPLIALAIGTLIVNAAEQFIKDLPTLIKALKVLLLHILDTVVELAPQLAKAFVAIVTAALDVLDELYPKMQDAGWKLLLKFLDGVNENLGELVDVVTNIIITFTTALAENANKLVDAGINLLVSFLNAIAERASDIAEAGLNLLSAFLEGIAQNISRVIDSAVKIVLALIQGITENMLLIIDAGTQMLISLLFGISENLDKVVTVVALVITEFIESVSENATRIAESGTNALISFLSGVTADTIRVANAVTTMITTFITAVGNNAQRIMDAGTAAIIKFLEGVKTNSTMVMRKFSETGLHIMNTLADTIVFSTSQVLDILLDFLRELRSVIDSRSEDIGRAGRLLAGAIINGLTGGLAAKAGDVANKLKDIAGSALDGVKGLFGINSPSRVFMTIGKQLMQGLVIGIDKNGNSVENMATSVASNVVTKMQETLNQIPIVLASMDELNPVITPVLDLTKVQSDAKNLDKMMVSRTITPQLSIDQAKTLAFVSNSQNGSESTPSVPVVQEVKYEQNVYSPEALSTAEIYRQTKSLITVTKEELGIS